MFFSIEETKSGKCLIAWHSLPCLISPKIKKSGLCKETFGFPSSIPNPPALGRGIALIFATGRLIRTSGRGEKGSVDAHRLFLTTC